MPDNKEYTKQVTERFIREMDKIVGITGDKIPQYKFSEIIGISPGNLTRLRNSPNNYVTVEACCKLCMHFGTDPKTLLLGEDHEKMVDERIQKLDQIADKLNATVRKLSKEEGRGPKKK